MVVKLIDVNTFAIYFVENHPGFPFIKPKIEKGIVGEYQLMIPEILPFRAYWILTTKWAIEKHIAKEIIFDFLKNYSNPTYIGLNRQTLLEAFQLSNELHHDIYDCYYLALAKQEKADIILTTDTDFEKLCPKVDLGYDNPVPLDILKKFSSYK